MVKHNRCTICLTDNKRASNVFNTDLQYVYENLANIKVCAGACWMCYICHKRLQQCHRLQQLAVQTRGLVNIVCENKVEKENRALQSLLVLTTSEIKTVCNTNFPLCVKEEPKEWAENFNTIDVEHDEFTATNSGHKYNEKPSIKTCTDSDDDVPLVNIAALSKQNSKNGRKNTKKPKLSNEKQSLSTLSDKSGHQTPNNHIVTGNYFVEVPPLALCLNENVEIKKEIEEETLEKAEDRGSKQGERQEHINYEKRNQATAAKTDGNERPFTCDVCSKTFTRRAYLKNHSRIHSDHKPYSCDLCPQKFSWKVSLKTHRITHTGEKPFSCDICSKKFTQKFNLGLHKRTHTGEKPFSCEYCPMKFSLKGPLQRHIRSHMGEKIYGCHLCPRKFSVKLNLQYHIKTHVGVS